MPVPIPQRRPDDLLEPYQDNSFFDRFIDTVSGGLNAYIDFETARTELDLARQQAREETINSASEPFIQAGQAQQRRISLATQTGLGLTLGELLGIGALVVAGAVVVKYAT